MAYSVVLIFDIYLLYIHMSSSLQEIFETNWVWCACMYHISSAIINGALQFVCVFKKSLEIHETNVNIIIIYYINTCTYQQPMKKLSSYNRNKIETCRQDWDGTVEWSSVSTVPQ